MTKNKIHLPSFDQTVHLFLIHQGTRKEEDKASITILESVSNQKFLQPLFVATSIAIIAPQNSAIIVEPCPKLMQSNPSNLIRVSKNPIKRTAIG